MDGLVERAAGRVHALGKHVDRHPVERDGNEDAALVRRELGPHRGRDRPDGLAALGAGCGEPEPSSSPAQRSDSIGTSRPCQARRRSFTAASSNANLYAQVVKRLSPRIVIELGEDRDECVISALVSEVVEVAAAKVRQKVPASSDLVASRAQEQVVKVTSCLVPGRTLIGQRRHPRPRFLVGSVGRR